MLQPIIDLMIVLRVIWGVTKLCLFCTLYSVCIGTVNTHTLIWGMRMLWWTCKNLSLECNLSLNQQDSHVPIQNPLIIPLHWHLMSVWLTVTNGWCRDYRVGEGHGSGGSALPVWLALYATRVMRRLMFCNFHILSAAESNEKSTHNGTHESTSKSGAELLPPSNNSYHDKGIRGMYSSKRCIRPVFPNLRFIPPGLICLF